MKYETMKNLINMKILFKWIKRKKIKSNWNKLSKKIKIKKKYSILLFLFKDGGENYLKIREKNQDSTKIKRRANKKKV